MSHLRQEQISLLDQQISACDKAAEIEKHRLQIQEQFSQRWRSLTEEMKTAAADQRPAIQAALAALPGQMAMAQQLATAQSFSGIGKQMLSGVIGGSPILERLSRMQDIRQGFTDQAAQLQAVIDDPNTPPEVKEKARQALAMIPQMQAGELARAGRSGMNFDTTAGSIFNTGGRLTGADLAARSQAFLSQHSGDNEQVQQGKAMLDIQKAILDWLRQHASQAGAGRSPAPFIH